MIIKAALDPTLAFKTYEWKYVGCQIYLFPFFPFKIVIGAFSPQTDVLNFLARCGVAECVCGAAAGDNIFYFLFSGCGLELESGFRNEEAVACGPVSWHLTLHLR